MKCSKCGNEIPPQSRFCLSCGAPVTPPAPAPRPTVPRAELPKKRLGLWAGLAGLAVVAIIALALSIFAGKGRVMDTNSPDGSQSPVMNTRQGPGLPQSGVLNTNSPEPFVPMDPGQQPPQEILQYLEFLKSIDQRRLALQDQEKVILYALIKKSAVDPLKQMLKEMDESDAGDAPEQGDSEVQREMTDLPQQWSALLSDFNSVTPPEACRQLAWQYSNALGSVSSSAVDILTMVSKQDLAGVQMLTGQSANIDNSLEAADGELGSVCRQYGIKKTYTITSDRGVAGVFNAPQPGMP